MISPEKNDISLDRLFKWGKQVSINDKQGNELFSCYIRLVGDAELNRARIFALRKSAELRRLLRSTDSEERLAFIVDFESVDEEKLVEMITYMNTRDITMKVINRVDIPFPKEPQDDASLEEQENYQSEVDSWPSKREAKIREEIEKEAEKLRNNLRGQGKEKLYKQYEDSVIAEMCESEMTKQYRQICTFFGLYKDEKYKEKLFTEFETFDNLLPDYKSQLMEAYMTLELSMDELKK